MVRAGPQMGRWRSTAPRLLRPPIERQIVLGVQQDSQNRFSVRRRQSSIQRRLVFPSQHFPQTSIEPVPDYSWKRVESLRIDEEAARVTKHAAGQVEFTQRPPGMVPRSAL